jgi:hypothetical protein
MQNGSKKYVAFSMHKVKLYGQQNGRTFHLWVRDIWEWIAQVSSSGLLALLIFLG